MKGIEVEQVSDVLLNRPAITWASGQDRRRQTAHSTANASGGALDTRLEHGDSFDRVVEFERPAFPRFSHVASLAA